MCLPDQQVLHHVIDVHCHPTDSDIPAEYLNELPISICAMATRQSDQNLVRDLARRLPQKVTPCFGYHPWFTHHISLPNTRGMSKEDHYRTLFLNQNDGPSCSSSEKHTEAFSRLLPLLPEPTSLELILDTLRRNLQEFPDAMLGEVGLDRSARVPYDYHAESRELTPFSVPFDHQVAILEAQIDVAVELRRNISLHSVRAPQQTLDFFNKMRTKHGKSWTDVSVDMHSCGLSAEMWKGVSKSHCNVFVSVSTAINGRSGGLRSLIAAVPEQRILVESDIHDITQVTQRTWDMLGIVADVRGWAVEDSWDDDLPEESWGAVRRIEANWQAFRNGNHEPVTSKKAQRKKGTVV